MKLLSNKYFKNFFWLSLDFVSKSVILIISNYLIFNSIESSQYGIISLSSNLIIILYTILSFGSNFTYLRRFSDANSIQLFNKEFSQALSLRVLISGFTFLIILLLYFFDLLSFPLLFIYTTLCFELIIVYNEIVLSKNKTQFKTLSNFFSDLIYLLFLAFLHYNEELNFLTFSYVFCLRVFLRMIFFISFGYLKLDLKYSIDINFNYAKMLFKDSYPLIFSTVSNIYLIVVIQFLISHFVGDEKLGIFSAGYYLVSLSMVFFTVFSNSLNSYTHKNQNNKFRNSRLITFVFYTTLFGIIINYFYGPKLLVLFFSKNFENSINVFVNFSPYLLMISFKPIIDKLLLYRNQRKVLATRNLFLLIFNSLIVYIGLFLGYDYKLTPYILFLSEILVLIYYYLNFETRYLLYEIIHGVFKFKLI